MGSTLLYVFIRVQLIISPWSGWTNPHRGTTSSGVAALSSAYIINSNSQCNIQVKNKWVLACIDACVGQYIFKEDTNSLCFFFIGPLGFIQSLGYWLLKKHKRFETRCWMIPVCKNSKQLIWKNIFLWFIHIDLVKATQMIVDTMI